MHKLRTEDYIMSENRKEWRTVTENITHRFNNNVCLQV